MKIFWMVNQLNFSLLSQMLNTPSDLMYYVDTIDKAGRWGITIGPTLYDEPINKMNLGRACANALAWDSDKSALGKEDLTNYYASKLVIKRKDGYTNGVITTDDIVDEICEFNFENNIKTISGIDNMKLGDAGFRATPIIYFLNPEMPISFLLVK